MDGWVNNREAGDLRRYLAHYDVIVMWLQLNCTINCQLQTGIQLENVSQQLRYTWTEKKTWSRKQTKDIDIDIETPAFIWR